MDICTLSTSQLKIKEQNQGSPSVPGTGDYLQDNIDDWRYYYKLSKKFQHRRENSAAMFALEKASILLVGISLGRQ